jgi:hypothetical protein
MHSDPIADELERVLNFNGQPFTWQVPENAVITPGAGPNIWDGLVLSGWVS